MNLRILLGGLVLLLVSSISTAAQEATPQELFLQNCGSCHLNPPTEAIPGMAVLTEMDTRAIVTAMVDGPMRIQAQSLSQAQRVGIAEYISGSALVALSNSSGVGLCSNPLELDMSKVSEGWNGWGGDSSNRRFKSDEKSISPAQVSNLTLKWAFGIANATQSRSQPAIVDDVLFMTSQTGLVHALDAKSGCTYWSFQADSSIRTAVSVAAVDLMPADLMSVEESEEASLTAGSAIFFTDAQTTVYAVNAVNGELLWTTKLDEHPAAAASGALTYHNGVLYAPVSGVSEESASSRSDYECCTFRGSISALNASTGERIWKSYTVDEPRPRGTNAEGTPLWGPAGVAVWSSPTIDEKRGLLYIATGNAYADPAPSTSDSILAMSIETGEIQWVNQVLNDVWIMGCNEETASTNLDGNPNCPGEVGPDFDFSASPVLTTLSDGRDIIIATQKSGLGFALDPDNSGALIWDYRWGDGSAAGGVWGAAVDEKHAYFAVADMFSPVPGGLKAVELYSGKEVWSSPPQDPLCGGGQGCNSGQGAAVTTVAGLVFSGANDGGMRAYSAETGEVLWVYNTGRSFDTVNGVEASGGSIDGPGPIVVDGMLYVTSGNGGFFGSAGNVLLAFEIKE